MLAIAIDSSTIPQRGGRAEQNLEESVLRITAIILLYVCCMSPALAGPRPDVAAWQLPHVHYPPGNPYTKAKAELGRMLFFDPRLSNDPSQTCATCHNPGLDWTDGMPRAMSGGHALSRHTPSLVNIGYNKAFFWDGRASRLEDAILQDILSSRAGREQSEEEIVDRLSAIRGYRLAFWKAFGSNSITMEHISQALATFVRGIVSRTSAFDRWLAGKKSALSPSARRGFSLFNGKAGCVRCHSGPTFTDSSFHNTGINSIDPGHFEVSGKEKDRNAFKTPGLRDVALTAPYMHNGTKKTLRDVLNFYNRGGDRVDSGNELGPLHLSHQEEQDLIAFLKSLTGKRVETAIPILPVSE